MLYVLYGIDNGQTIRKNTWFIEKFLGSVQVARLDADDAAERELLIGRRVEEPWRVVAPRLPQAPLRQAQRAQPGRGHADDAGLQRGADLCRQRLLLCALAQQRRAPRQHNLSRALCATAAPERTVQLH